MLYISIPVNESFDAVASQAKNFERYLPKAILVIHLSANAHFSKIELENFLKLNAVTNVVVNPVQVNTNWGDIFLAHLKNIEFIKKIGDATKIAFHSSNDMLVREGLADYLQDKDFVFHQRNVPSHSNWWPGNVANDDFRFTDWLAIHGGGAIVASQIEGSVYPMWFLEELCDEILNRYPILSSDKHYPREELFFSSFAVAKGIKSQGIPYILSEVHRFDKSLWYFLDNYKFILNDEYKPLKKIKKRFIHQLFNANFYKINLKDIEAIRKQDKDYLSQTQYMSDGSNVWQVHTINNLYGVKRVERSLTNPVRQYLTR